MIYLSWFLFFLAGVLFSKLFSAMLDLGVVVSFSRTISDRILVSLLMLTQELEYLRELKIDVLKEKGATEEQINLVLEILLSLIYCKKRQNIAFIR